MSSVSDKARLFAKNFSKKFHLEESGTSLPVFPSRINLKQHNISVTPRIVEKVITNLDLSKASGRDCISTSGGSKELCAWTFDTHYLNFLVCVSNSLLLKILGRCHWWPLYLRILGKGTQLKVTTLLIFFLWSVKSLKNCVNLNNRLVDHLEKCCLFSDF